jgi:hypothetical protein
MTEERPAAGDPGQPANETRAEQARPLVWPGERRAPIEPETPPVPAARADSEPEGGAAGAGIVSQIHSVAGPVASAIASVFEAAATGVSVFQAANERRLKRQAREPLPNLYELFPEARLASPRELGMRFVPVEEIRGTAVAGATQRGGDFLPIPRLRGENWVVRWQRIREANRSLQPLPPVDLIKYDGDFWVVDGHNRVAATLYDNGVGLDAMVTELVPLDGQISERPSALLPYLGESREMRVAAQGHRPAIGMRQVEQQSTDEAATFSQYDEPAPDEPEASTGPESEPL